MARSSGAECAPCDGGTVRCAAVVRQGGSGVCSARRRAAAQPVAGCSVCGARHAGRENCGRRVVRRSGGEVAWWCSGATKHIAARPAMRCRVHASAALHLCVAPLYALSVKNREVFRHIVPAHHSKRGCEGAKAVNGKESETFSYYITVVPLKRGCKASEGYPTVLYRQKFPDFLPPGLTKG